MFLIKIIRLILGYVEFEATGGFSERFINLCNINGILLWDVSYKKNSLLACVKANDYKYIREPAKRSGMKVRIKRKRGLPFIAFKHKARFGLLAGFIMLLIFISFMSMIIWEIEVDGNVDVSPEKIIETVNEEGIKIGVLKRNIDIDTVKKNSLSKLPEISWIAINILGTKLQIEVRETEESPDIIDLETPVNIVANKDGIVKNIEVGIGEKVVELGEAVLKGDLLISGVVMNKDNTETLYHAQGKVFAETTTILYGKQNLSDEAKTIISVKNVYYINFFSIKIPLCLKGENFFSKNIMLKSKKTTLPIGLTKGVRYEFSDTELNHSRKQAELLSFFYLVKEERESQTECEIIKASHSVMQGENSVIIKGEYKAIENIALQKEIYIDEKDVKDNEIK